MSWPSSVFPEPEDLSEFVAECAQLEKAVERYESMLAGKRIAIPRGVDGRHQTNTLLRDVFRSAWQILSLAEDLDGVEGWPNGRELNGHIRAIVQGTKKTLAYLVGDESDSEKPKPPTIANYNGVRWWLIANEQATGELFSRGQLLAFTWQPDESESEAGSVRFDSLDTDGIAAARGLRDQGQLPNSPESLANLLQNCLSAGKPDQYPSLAAAGFWAQLHLVLQERERSELPHPTLPADYSWFDCEFGPFDDWPHIKQEPLDADLGVNVVASFTEFIEMSHLPWGKAWQRARNRVDLLADLLDCEPSSSKDWDRFVRLGKIYCRTGRPAVTFADFCRRRGIEVEPRQQSDAEGEEE